MIVELYGVYGYDKDSDAYVHLLSGYVDLQTMIKVADYMATLCLKRKSNNEPFDWLEVRGGGSGKRYHVAPCV